MTIDILVPAGPDLRHFVGCRPKHLPAHHSGLDGEAATAAREPSAEHAHLQHADG